MVRHPSSPEVRLEYLDGQTIHEGNFDKAFLPIGATEYHGPHLPFGTDTIAAVTLAETFARELGESLVLPAISVGVSHHHLPWKWTLSLKPDTLMLVVRDTALSLLHNGITKLVIVAVHDGNPGPVEAAARILHQDHGMRVAVFKGWQGKARQLLKGERDIDLDHAGQAELSMVLYSMPEYARPEFATAQPEQNVDHPLDLVDSFDGSVPLGYSGDATRATAAEGEAVVRVLTDQVVPWLRQLDEHGWRRGAWMSGIEP